MTRAKTARNSRENTRSSRSQTAASPHQPRTSRQTDPTAGTPTRHPVIARPYNITSSGVF
jgi:hypothetical protein